MKRWVTVTLFVLSMLAVLLIILTAVRELPENLPAVPSSGITTVNFEYRFPDSVLAAIGLVAAALGSAVLLGSRSAVLEVIACLAAIAAIVGGIGLYSMLEVAVAVTIAAAFVLLARNLAGGRR